MTRPRPWIAVLAALAAAAVPFSAMAVEAASAPAEAAPTFRLPPGARPLHYDLALTVTPGEPDVSGEIAIDVELDAAQSTVWLNADAIAVSGASVDVPGMHATIVRGSPQFVGVAFDPPLAGGRHRITLQFTAAQSRNSARGVFSLEDQGARYTMTQFEPMSARRAFPCFDEPAFKTPWRLTLRVPRDLVALSNGAVASETMDADGLKTVRFAETRPLPTYLVAFAVGPWETMDLGPVGESRTPMRIVVPRGRLADASFAARAYPELFTRLESWFGIPYPFGKLDHIAIPLTVGFAMENAGLITYGAPTLLARPGADTPGFRRSTANTGTHEISHQWFGNLVTSRWWDDIWLNEAFATWIAAKIVDEWRPDYEHGAGRVAERAYAIDSDTLVSARRIREPVSNPGDIMMAFDTITYQKGAAVIGMFEEWIGPEPFRQGVRRYLEARRDSTATAGDFLGALTEASHMPVAPAFETFLNQNGVPRIDVRLHCDAQGPRVALTQSRFELLGAKGPIGQLWQIPVCVRYGAPGAMQQACTLMTTRSATVPLQGACPSLVFANAAGRGYYVPDYRDGLLDRIARGRQALSVAEFQSLLQDMRPLLRAGALDVPAAMRWIRYAAAAADRPVVQAALDLAQYVGTEVVSPTERPRYAAFVRDVFGPRARQLGFAPKAGESDDDTMLRRALLRVVAPEDPQLAAEARRLARAWVGDRASLDPSLVDVTLVTAARTGDAALLDLLMAEAKATQDRLDRRYLMMALLSFTRPGLAEKGMSILLDPAFDVRESWTAVRYAYYYNPGRPATSAFIRTNFDALVKTVGPDTPGGWAAYFAGQCSAQGLADLRTFWKDRAARFVGADREVAEAAETIEVCVRVRAHAQRRAGAR